MAHFKVSRSSLFFTGLNLNPINPGVWATIKELETTLEVGEDYWEGSSPVCPWTPQMTPLDTPDDPQMTPQTIPMYVHGHTRESQG